MGLSEMNIPIRKILSVALNVFARILTVISVVVMVFTVVTVMTVDKNERNILGFRFFIVQSDSMSLSENNEDMRVHFDTGDIVIVRKVSDKKPLESGEIISFISYNDETYGKTVTHMIREVHMNGDEVVGYTTYGTNTGADDKAMVKPEHVLGRYVCMIPDMGDFFNGMKTTRGYILFVLIPFTILILSYVINIIRTLRAHREQMDGQLEEERRRLEEERAETQRMMQEILVLKAQLEQKNGVEAAPPEASVSDADEVAAGRSTEESGVEENVGDGEEKINAEIEKTRKKD